MNFLRTMFSEPGGKPSSTRAMAAIVCACVVGTWTGISWRKGELQPLSAEQVMLVGVALGMKAWQRGKDAPGEVPAPKA